MKKWLLPFGLLPWLLILCGCSAIGEKAGSLVWVYGAVAVLSLLLLVGYCVLVPQKNIWFLLLFVSVLVVNVGYYALSVSGSVEEALLANRISYLGSVFLPLSMMMIILTVAKIPCPKWITGVLLTVSIFVFLVAASPGYLDIYYREVSLQTINGVSVLNKVYGPWHSLYLYYLLGYFASMLAVILVSSIKKKIRSLSYTIILLMAVLVNLGVWFFEQLVRIDFEVLCVSYIITELFLLGVHLVMVENEKLKAMIRQQEQTPEEDSSIRSNEEKQPDPQVCRKPAQDEQTELFVAGVAQLTPTERMIYQAYLDGLGTKDVLLKLNIKENTLKYHNKNIYSKLGVSSRKQLLEIAARISK